MTKFVQKLTLLCFLTLSLPLSASPLYIDYYGVISQSTESNILKMAQDIFFTQLKSLANISVDDKRTDAGETLRTLPDFSETVAPHLAFYAEIAETAENGSKSWQCTFSLLQVETQTLQTKTEQFDSYYKILVNAKTSIEQVLEKAAGPEKGVPEKSAEAQPPRQIKLEALAGTWQGEPNVDKIILLRGGKGFVIFKNGASMNVKVTVTETDGAGNIAALTVTQDAKANASFFPQLPRETALALAADAPPIIWNMHIASDGSLSGTRQTLIPDSSAPSGATLGTESSVWTKK